MLASKDFFMEQSVLHLKHIISLLIDSAELCFKTKITC